MSARQFLVVLVAVGMVTAFINVTLFVAKGPEKVPIVCGSPPAGAWIRYSIQVTNGPNMGGPWRDDPSGCFFYPDPQYANVTLLQVDPPHGGHS